MQFGEVGFCTFMIDCVAKSAASSNTGSIALQIAKLVGLRVICIADLVRHGARLNQLGADVLVDRQDSSRATEIIRSVTKGELRFGIDAVGKETVGHLQNSLQQQKDAKQAHLVGLTGLPKDGASGVKHHAVPIKVFHTTAAVGEAIIVWLEQLLLANALTPPDVDVAAGGLEGINDALDQLRGGSVSGKRIVVPLENGATSKPGNANEKPQNLDKASSENKDDGKPQIGSLEYATKLNADPSRIKIA